MFDGPAIGSTCATAGSVKASQTVTTETVRSAWVSRSRSRAIWVVLPDPSAPVMQMVVIGSATAHLRGRCAQDAHHARVAVDTDPLAGTQGLGGTLGVQ